MTPLCIGSEFSLATEGKSPHQCPDKAWVAWDERLESPSIETPLPPSRNAQGHVCSQGGGKQAFFNLKPPPPSRLGGWVWGWPHPPRLGGGREERSWSESLGMGFDTPKPIPGMPGIP